MSLYKHGAYGFEGDEAIGTVAESMMCPLYVGRAPVNLIRGYKTAGIINTAVLLTDLAAKNTIGYSDDWDKFDLSMALIAHFKNANGNVGPIYVVNVLDPDVHRKSDETNVDITFSHGSATIDSDTIIIDTFALDGKVEGVDYALNYNFTTGQLIISSVDKENKLDGTIAASYFEVDPSAVTESDIIGGKTDDGVYTGLQVGNKIFPEDGVIINFVLAPNWSHIPAVYTALTDFCQSINNHWYAFVLADLPIEDGDGNPIDTFADIIDWKEENAYNSMYAKSFWPKHIGIDNQIYLDSVLACVEFMRCDRSHDGIPMETCSNKVVPVRAPYFGEKSKNQGFDKDEANTLNEKGISTIAPWGGKYVLWGNHTDRFEAGDDGNVKPGIPKRAIFDVSVRIQEYIMNKFQDRWGDVIDEPMDIGLKDKILNDEQEWLDGLASKGALIGAPVIAFLVSDNSTTDLMNGNFTWDIQDTPTPPAKSLSARVSYTDAGFNAYFGEED